MMYIELKENIPHEESRRVQKRDKTKNDIMTADIEYETEHALQRKIR